MFKNQNLRIYDRGGLFIDDTCVGLSISQWLPCPLAIWNLLFGVAILLNLVKIVIIGFAGFRTQDLSRVRRT